MLDDCGNVESCGCPDDLSGALPQGANIILLSELFLPRGEYGALEQLRLMRPDARIVVMGTSSDPQRIAEIFKAGASGYVSGDSAFRALRSQLDLVALGEKVYPATLIEHLSRVPAAELRPSAMPWPDLTPRERTVLDGLVCGLPNKVIAAETGVSEATVKLALKTLFRKMKVRNRTHAAMLAKEHGWKVSRQGGERLH